MRRSLRVVELAFAVTSLALTMVATVSTGAASAATAADKSPIKIGQIVTLTSPAFEFTSAKAALDASVNDINAKGGLDGHPLDPITCDDQGSATVAAECATKLINEDGVVAIGGGVSGYTSPVLAAAKANKVPTFCSTEIAKGTANYPQFYACAPSTIGYAQAALLFQPSWNTVAYLNYQGFPPSEPLVAQGQKVAGTHVNLKIINVPLTTTDWTPIAAEVKSLGANAVLSQLAGSGDEAMIQAMVTESLKIPYLETSGQAYSTTIATALKEGVHYDVASSWINDPKHSSVRAKELADLAKYAPGINDTTADPTNDSWLFPQLLKLGADSGQLKEFTRVVSRSGLAPRPR